MVARASRVDEVGDAVRAAFCTRGAIEASGLESVHVCRSFASHHTAFYKLPAYELSAGVPGQLAGDIETLGDFVARQALRGERQQVFRAG